MEGTCGKKKRKEGRVGAGRVLQRRNTGKARMGGVVGEIGKSVGLRRHHNREYWEPENLWSRRLPG